MNNEAENKAFDSSFIVTSGSFVAEQLPCHRTKSQKLKVLLRVVLSSEGLVDTSLPWELQGAELDDCRAPVSTLPLQSPSLREHFRIDSEIHEIA
jgi:hypothetical protein